MKSKFLWTLLPSALLLASPAQAHFRLDAPPPAIQINGTGDPQKPASLTDHCPDGTASGLATQARPGDKIKVKITETVPHGGHYRVSFGANEAAFSFPNTVASGNQCNSTTIATNPTLPILADGLFVHTQTEANAANFCNGTATCESDVTVPNVAPGNYVLQVIEWMLPHGSAANNGIHGCFYAQCATIQVVAADAGVADGGVVKVDGGASGSDGGSSGGSGSDGGEDEDEGSSGSSKRLSSTPADEGCGVASANGANLWAPLIVALASMRMMRRRRDR